MNSYISPLEHPIRAGDLLFFMHTPKTAGTTLIQIIEQQFNSEEIARWLYPFRLVDTPLAFFREHCYFHGHVEYSLMRSLLPKEPITITMLRDPVERYLSHYGNHQRVRFDQIPDITLEEYNQFKQTSLIDFVQSPPKILIPIANYFQNLQAKFLASEPDENIPLEERKQLIRNGQYILTTPDYTKANKQMEQLTLVGITERFQDSLFLMAYTFGWLPVIEYKKFNSAQPRPQQDKLDPELLQELHRLNHLDQQIYDDGCRLFQTRYVQMEQELLERYGKRESAYWKLPLSNDQMVELLDLHYRHHFIQQNSSLSSIKVDFNKKMPGTNWHAKHNDPNFGWMRWTGPGRCASLNLPITSEADVWLRFSVIGTLHQSVVNSLQVTVNGEPIYLDFYLSNIGEKIHIGYVAQSILTRQPGCIRINFEVEETIRPIDVIAESNDDRSFGIAMNWFEIKPALPLINEATTMKKYSEMLAEKPLQLTENLRQIQNKNQTLESQLMVQEKTLQAVQRELHAIHVSRTWRFAQRLSAIYKRLKHIFKK